MLRIGVIGYYGWGNYGDELFLDAYRRFLAPHDVVVLPDSTQRPYFTDLEKSLEKVDAVVIGGGDLIIPWKLSDLYWNPQYLSKPVFIYGVGVPWWGGESPEVVSAMADFVSHENVKAIITRDPRSHDWVRRQFGCEDKLDWFPDVVAALDFRQSRTPRRRPIFTLVTRLQTEDRRQEIGKVCRWAGHQGYAIRHLILSYGATAHDDLREAAGVLYAPREIVIRGSTSALTAELMKSSLIASMKFHGCVVGLMAGIPTVALSMSNKFVSFYDMMQVPELTSTLVSEDLQDVLDTASRMGRVIPRRDIRDRARDGLLALRSRIDQVARL